MKILSLETTERIGMIAALSSEQVLLERSLDPTQRSACSLTPGVEALLAEVGWRAADIALVAVAKGPGSFTGLRVGVTMAKTFAFAAGAEVLGVNTLEVIATRAPQEISCVHVALDAQRQQVFAARYQRHAEGAFIAAAPTKIVDNEAWLQGLLPGDVVSGPALKQLSALVPAGVILLDSALWIPTASAVGQLAYAKYQAGIREDVFALLPDYYRLSAAEEKKIAAQKNA